jgi:hypothetical protein
MLTAGNALVESVAPRVDVTETDSDTDVSAVGLKDGSPDADTTPDIVTPPDAVCDPDTTALTDGARLTEGLAVDD